MNETVGTKDPLGMSGRKKRLVSPLKGKIPGNLLVEFYT